MEKIIVKVVNKSNNQLPDYATSGSAGLDLKANLGNNTYTLKPGARVLVPTGIYIELPEGYELQLRPRSGFALKYGITLANSPSTIDSDYRGEIGIILINHGHEDFIINHGERICQAVLNKVEQLKWLPVYELNKTERGEGGFGHTGKN